MILFFILYYTKKSVLDAAIVYASIALNQRKYCLLLESS